jgi:hypothetical protein
VITVKIKVYFSESASGAIRTFGTDPEMETDAHPREQIAQFQCVVARTSDRREVMIPAHAISLVESK